MSKEHVSKETRDGIERQKVDPVKVFHERIKHLQRLAEDQSTGFVLSHSLYQYGIETVRKLTTANLFYWTTDFPDAPCNVARFELAVHPRKESGYRSDHKEIEFVEGGYSNYLPGIAFTDEQGRIFASFSGLDAFLRDDLKTKPLYESMLTEMAKKYGIDMLFVGADFFPSPIWKPIIYDESARRAYERLVRAGHLSHLARKRGLTITEYLRLMITGEVPSEKPDK